MFLLIFYIVLLLIAAVLGLLIDCPGVAKLGLFMNSVGIFGNAGIFCEFSADWEINWLMRGFFHLDPALPSPILCFTSEVSLNEDLETCFSGCTLGSKLLLTHEPLATLFH